MLKPNEIDLLGHIGGYEYTETYKVFNILQLCGCLKGSTGGGKVHYILVKKEKHQNDKRRND